MKEFIKIFTDSAKEFKNLRSVVTVALLIALHTVMAMFLSIQVTSSLRISLSFLANCIIGCMYGPVMGFVAGGLGDIIQFILKPTGPYFVGWTLSAALACMIYGCFFYGTFKKQEGKNEKKLFDIRFFVRCATALTFDTILINILLGTCWVSFMYGKGFAFYLTSRFIKNAVQLPINIILTYYVLSVVRKLRIHK
ncbi:MAG: folate family ECF transporter S component [Eubacteriales bacterium]|nr:folate family ECF transporter S component [Eubacteriales bacterium]